MNVEELLDLLRRYEATGCLVDVVQNAIARLESSTSVQVVVGEQQSHDKLLNIYEGRLRRTKMCGIEIPGLVETVASFNRVKGTLRGGYAQTDGGLIYFLDRRCR